MHRFYMFHSMTVFHRNAIAPTAIFLAAKVEEQPRPLESVIRVAYQCLNKKPGPPKDSKVYIWKNVVRNFEHVSVGKFFRFKCVFHFLQDYDDKILELISNEDVLIRTLGFNVAVDHPHTHIVRCCQLVKGQFHYHLQTENQWVTLLLREIFQLLFGIKKIFN